MTPWPQVGNAAFAVPWGNAPPNAGGFLAFGDAGLATPIVVPGAALQIWVDLLSPAFSLFVASSDAVGAAQVALPIPALPFLAGSQGHLKCFWFRPSAASPPCPPLGVSASNGLAIPLQP